METENFEKELIQMSKPEVSHLRHQEMLSKVILKAKDKSVLSWWWISIPLYLLATLLMKSLFMPSTTLISNLHELRGRVKQTSILFFILLPVVFIVFNFLSIRKIYLLSGNPKTFKFLSVVWFNLIIIILSLLILMIYSL